MSLISVKFAIRLSLVQPSFQGPILLFLRSVSASFRRVGEDPGNEVVFTAECRIEHKTVVQSSYKSGKIISSSPENCYCAMPQTNNSDLKTIKSLCVCVCVSKI